MDKESREMWEELEEMDSDGGGSVQEAVPTCGGCRLLRGAKIKFIYLASGANVQLTPGVPVRFCPQCGKQL